MSEVLQQLLSLLKLEAIGVNRFRGRSQDLGFRNLFGGQVLGQSLSAAIQTLNSTTWVPHSLHAYFLRPGIVVLVKPKWTRLIDNFHTQPESYHH